jgi:hypothetical protein
MDWSRLAPASKPSTAVARPRSKSQTWPFIAAAVGSASFVNASAHRSDLVGPHRLRADELPAVVGEALADLLSCQTGLHGGQARWSLEAEEQEHCARDGHLRHALYVRVSAVYRQGVKPAEVQQQRVSLSCSKVP